MRENEKKKYLERLKKLKISAPPIPEIHVPQGTKTKIFY
jgi:hypothetical protein